MSNPGALSYATQPGVLSVRAFTLGLVFFLLQFAHASSFVPAPHSAYRHVLLVLARGPGLHSATLARAIGVRPQSNQSGLLRGRITVANWLEAGRLDPSIWGRYGKYLVTGFLALLFQSALIVVLLMERRRGKVAQVWLARSFAIERVLTQLSTALADCPPEKLHVEIETSLRELVDAERIDEACWTGFLESTHERTIYVANRYSDSRTPILDLSRMPWSTEQLIGGNTVVIKALDDLPQAASPDRGYLSGRRVMSAVLVPSGSGESRGVLGLVCTSAERSWPKTFVGRLAVLGNLIRDALLRKKAQEAKQASERRFRDLFEQVPLGIALEDLEGRLLFVNPALCSMLGYTAEEIRGMRCDHFSDQDDAAADWALFQELQAGSRATYHLEKRYRRKDGTQFWGRASILRVPDQPPGGPAILAMLEDVTERQRAQDKWTQAQSLLYELPSRLIHAQEEERQRIARELHDDIGQRLSLVMIQLEHINRELPIFPSLQFGDFASLLQDVDEITTDIHQLSHQLHSSKLQHLGLNAALNEVCKQITQQHKIAVIKELDDASELPAEIQLCLYRVAQEALGNVARHSRAVTTWARLTVESGMACLEITDNGRGFDPSSATQGLGLASMRERLRAVHGEFRVTSSKGQGTKIVAMVPFEEDIALGKVS